MVQSEPDLPGIGAVIFDEFHERSLNADLGLALCLEVIGVLRDDPDPVGDVRHADAEPVGNLMDAPLVTSEGRSYPVETRWLDRPLGPQARRLDALIDLVARAERETTGGMLVFLPGEGEIRRAEAMLSSRLPDACSLRPLFGALPFAAQRAVIAPVATGAQGGAGDVDSRNLADHTRHPRRGGYGSGAAGAV